MRHRGRGMARPRPRRDDRTTRTRGSTPAQLRDSVGRMTDAPQDGEPTAPPSGFLRLFLAALVTCMFAQGGWAVADAFADGRAPLGPGALGAVNAVLSSLALAFIPLVVFSLPASIPIALVAGCMAFVTERMPSRAVRMLVTSVTIAAAAAALGFFSSVELSSDGSRGATWSGASVLAFAALGLAVATPLSFWATRHPAIATRAAAPSAG
jgi:hypothetical protein